jgi:thiamine pyridinylase
VTRDGKIYAVPHWLCGNFLFYRSDAPYVGTSRTWEELVSSALQNKKDIFVDLKGRSTLGEWYLTLLSEKEGLSDAQKSIIEGDDADGTVLGTLNRILTACSEPYCRNDELHDIPGFYAKEFIRGKSIAYVGYSETLHYAIHELKNDCGPGTNCLKAEDIKVRALPSIAESSANSSLGWVEGLAISSDLSAEKRALAMDFIRFAVSNEAYEQALKPAWPYVPRYLIPARQRIVYENAPLYADLYAMFGERFTGSSLGLNTKLREFAQSKVECALDRHDPAKCGGQ